MITDQLGQERSNVVGEVDILGEASNRPVGLGQRRTSLEDERCPERAREQGLECPHDPDVLFQQIGGPAGRAGGDVEHLPAVGEGQIMYMKF